MSDLGPASPTPDHDPSTSSRRRRFRLVLGGLVAAVVAAGVGAFFLLRDDGPSYPKGWDARIQPYVDVVEKQRGLTFEHPVEVRFLDEKAFEKTVRADKDDLDADDRKEIDESTSLFRAFGLISGEVDLFKAFDDASGSGTLAYYSFDDEAITVRGRKLSLAVRATLVHELTHALQDQRFDIADRTEKLSKKATDGEATTAADALQAIVEGDAERVADLYRASLSEKDQKALEKAEAADTEDNQEALESVPPVVNILMGAPYALGEPLTQLVAAGDDDAVNELFEDPPADDSVLVDPLKALEDREPTDVAIPATGGEKKFDSGQIGDLTTFLMLAQRIPLRDALAAADTWTGDAYLGFRRGKTVCARVDYATGSSKDAAILSRALDRWIDAGPAGTDATSLRDGDHVTFESCDPGTEVKQANDVSESALTLAVTRAYLDVGSVQSGATPDVARCFSGKLLDEFTLDQLNDPDYGADDPAVQKRIQAAATSCG